MKARVLGFGIVLALGLAQMIGDVCGWQGLRAVANATTASPAPKVFTRVGEREPFSSRFALVVHDTSRAVQRVELTPERYARLRGPYNRRNAYGAAIAGGPVLVSQQMTAMLFWDAARYALCGAAPVLRELDVPLLGNVTRVDIEYVHAKNTEVEGDLAIVNCP